MQALYKFIPENYFVKDLKDNTLGSIKLALLREVKGNMIIRSNYPDETITFKASNDKDVVEIPARKLKSREKLMGLKICREFGVVDKEVRYNVIKKSTQLANPNSILFGDSVTESGDAVGLTSRAIYDWAYSLRDVSEITATLQHNALSEGGTMHNEDTGKLRQSLFQVQYVKPATFFPHFITVENVTPELFIHLLACVLFENRYGAQSTTQSANVQNHLVGVGFNLFEAPLNSFSLSQQWNGQEVNFSNVQAAMREAMQAAYGQDNYRNGEELATWIKTLWQKPDELKAHYEKAQEDCKAFLKAIKVTK
ncbi:type I-D CRISPR-associated protein Cas7/Csc2 [marine bacterium AO1-C]|nr:type I-D CRISPR-associated protein Cas7/Csc2 [marine bacterium AO1-C]